jgi:hypothetical protein
MKRDASEKQRLMLSPERVWDKTLPGGQYGSKNEELPMSWNSVVKFIHSSSRN